MASPTRREWCSSVVVRVPLMADYFLARHHLSDDGMAYRKAHRGSPLSSPVRFAHGPLRACDEMVPA